MANRRLILPAFLERHGKALGTALDHCYASKLVHYSRGRRGHLYPPSVTGLSLFPARNKLKLKHLLIALPKSLNTFGCMFPMEKRRRGAVQRINTQELQCLLCYRWWSRPNPKLHMLFNFLNRIDHYRGFMVNFWTIDCCCIWSTSKVHIQRGV